MPEPIATCPRCSSRLVVIRNARGTPVALKCPLSPVACREEMRELTPQEHVLATDAPRLFEGETQ